MTGFYRFFKLWCPLLFCLWLTVPSYSQCSFTNLDPAYCTDAAPVSLTGSTLYYGPGVSGTTFTPATAGVGTHTLYATSGNATAYAISTSGTFNRIVDAGTVVNPGDDGQVTGISLPFTFNFFGTDYTQLDIGRNAIVGFGPSTVDVTDNQSLPAGTTPDNLIAAAWDDLTLGGTIQYFTTGAAPFRKFVIDYDAVPRQGGVYTITTQIQLNESTNIIEIHTTSASFATNGNLGTQGIENSTGSSAYTAPGRNNQSWDATNDYLAFIPTCLDIQTVTVNPLPNISLGISPATASVCPSGSVAVTITGDQSNVNYQLQNTTGSVPLSGFWPGNGVGDLLISSDPITTPLTIKTYAINSTTGCDADLTTTVPVTINSVPTAFANDTEICSGGTTSIAITNPNSVPGTTFTWTVQSSTNVTGVLREQCEMDLGQDRQLLRAYL